MITDFSKTPEIPSTREKPYGVHAEPCGWAVTIANEHTCAWPIAQFMKYSSAVEAAKLLNQEFAKLREKVSQAIKVLDLPIERASQLSPGSVRSALSLLREADAMIRKIEDPTEDAS